MMIVYKILKYKFSAFCRHLILGKGSLGMTLLKKTFPHFLITSLVMGMKMVVKVRVVP